MNLRLTLILWSFLLAGNGLAQTITLTAEVPCSEVQTLFLYRFGGLHFDKADQAAVREGVAVFQLPEKDWQFYYLGANDKDVLPVILGRDKSVRVKVNCQAMSTSLIEDAPIHQAYQQLKSRMNGLKNQGNQLTREHYAALATGQTPELFLDEMGRLDQRKLLFLETTMKENPFLGKIVALNTYLSYYVQPNDYPNELAYFAAEYFRFVRWDDADLNYQPWVFEAWKAYAGALADTKLPAEQLIPLVDTMLHVIPVDSRVYMLALSGIIQALEKGNTQAFVHYSRRYIDRYGKTQPEEARVLQEKSTAQGRFLPGAEAPLFSQANPEGQMVALKDLRGKVLLIDFWASWCGPCRRENPAVRRLYDQYQSRGFDILGVSLDSDRQRWLDAIEKDGLVWTQVSDLLGWRNAAAELYQVSSIPHTVLLDAEGRILARNLRGAALEQKLAEIFGE